MIHLKLDDDQAVALRDALGRYLSDLSMEIADTDAKDYREHLKQRRDNLRALLEQLPQAAE
jgi:hypothetical protein